MRWVLLGVGLVAAVAFSIWLNSQPFWNGNATNARTSEDSNVRYSAAASGALPRVSIDGIVILDYSSGLPVVPYIQYTDAKGRLATKQLIYAGERGCAPSAGDLPCVPGYSVDAAYPSLADGQKITAQGYLFENRLLVSAISPG